MPQGSLHHTPWLRIPTQYGPFSNVHDLKRIGIRLEWCVDGEYKTAYTQSSGISNLSASPIYKNHTDHHHLPQQYIKMMNLFSALYNVDWQPNSPSWMAPICRLHIQEIKYNHMEQRLDVITPQRLRASAPVPLTSQHNHKKMLMDFGPRLVIGQKPDNVFAGITHAATYATHGDNPPIDHRNRQKCNYCNFEKIDQDIRKSGREIDGGCKPTLRNGEYSCAECAKLSLPCTWSLASDIRAYGWIGLSPDCVRNIAPQVIQTPFVTSTNTDVGLLRDDAASDSGEEQDFD
ncbi:hypothetical protein DL95DRAFT_396046 [Leptodontidium sp. 2 PMI_412]|nr:hypothetical protein DL95DRAFT_396046 [Leptodontidium sp. 2 PMI_412]